jgi:hypothetical protein
LRKWPTAGEAAEQKKAGIFQTSVNRHLYIIKSGRNRRNFFIPNKDQEKKPQEPVKDDRGPVIKEDIYIWQIF